MLTSTVSGIGLIQANECVADFVGGTLVARREHASGALGRTVLSVGSQLNRWPSAELVKELLARHGDPRVVQWVRDEVMRPLLWGKNGFFSKYHARGGRRFDAEDVSQYVFESLLRALRRFDTSRSPSASGLRKFLKSETKFALQRYLDRALSEPLVDINGDEDRPQDDDPTVEQTANPPLAVVQVARWTGGGDDFDKLVDDMAPEESRAVYKVIEDILNAGDVGFEHPLIKGGFLEFCELVAVQDAISQDGLRVDADAFARSAQEWDKPPTEPNRRANSALLRVLLGLAFGDSRGLAVLDALAVDDADIDREEAVKYLRASPEERSAQLSKDRNYGIPGKLFRALQNFYAGLTFSTQAAKDAAAYLETESGRQGVFDAINLGHIAIDPEREIHRDLIALLREPPPSGALLREWQARTVKHRASTLGILASFDLLARLAEASRRTACWGNAEDRRRAEFFEQFVEVVGPAGRTHCPRCGGEFAGETQGHSGALCLGNLLQQEASKLELQRTGNGYWLVKKRRESFFREILSCYDATLQRGGGASRIRSVIRGWDERLGLRCDDMVDIVMAAYARRHVTDR